MGNVLITPHADRHTPKRWGLLGGIVVENVEQLENGSRETFYNKVNGHSLEKVLSRSENHLGSCGTLELVERLVRECQVYAVEILFQLRDCPRSDYWRGDVGVFEKPGE